MALVRALGAGVLLLAASSADAQGIAFAGSESYVAEALSITGGGGYLVSASYAVAARIEGAAGPVESASAHYRALGGPALFGAWPTTEPIVFGVSSGYGDKGGTESVTVFGRGFSEPGAGTPSLDLDGLGLLAVGVTSNTTLAATTPQGVNAFGNPLGRTRLNMTNALGNCGRDAAFAFGPALLQETLPAVGSTLVLSLHSNPGSIVTVALGDPIPGLALPLFNFDGGLELLLNLTILTPFTPSLGLAQFAFPISNSPSYVGAAVHLQAVAIYDLMTLTGSFSNVRSITLQ
jgi:hypothetical protein